MTSSVFPSWPHFRFQHMNKIRYEMNSAIRVHACRNGRRIFAAASRRDYVVSRNKHFRLAPVPSRSAHPTLRGFSSSAPSNNDEPPKPDQPNDKEENDDVDAGDVPLSDSINPAVYLPFPWYNVPHGRLSRLDENNDLSGLPRTTRARFVRKTLAARELGVPWYQIFLTGSWERDLAQNFTWAFRRATAALLAKTFRVPIATIDIDDDESSDGFGLVSIDTTKVSGDGNGEDVMSEDDMEETNALVEAMCTRILTQQKFESSSRCNRYHANSKVPSLFPCSLVSMSNRTQVSRVPIRRLRPSLSIRAASKK